MRVRYKNNGQEDYSFRFNLHAIGEVLTCDDTVNVRDLDVWIDDLGWKDLVRTFLDRDVLPNNDNARFGPPFDAECRKRGYND